MLSANKNVVKQIPLHFMLAYLLTTLFQINRLAKPSVIRWICCCVAGEEDVSEWNNGLSDNLTDLDLYVGACVSLTFPFSFLE